MKTVFLSNFFNHHQSGLSDALWKKTSGEYIFIETSRMPQGRKRLGYSQEKKEYTLNAKDNEGLVLQEIRKANVMIAGSAPEYLIRERIKTGKLLFRYSERPLKNGLEPLKYFPRLVRWHWRNPWGKPIYMLCASAYTAGDYRKFGLFKNKTYKWGYFPETKRYPNVDNLMETKHPAEILWCGRFMGLKHPDDAIKVAKRLRAEGYTFSLNFVGMGPMEQQLHQMVSEYALEDCVHFLGTMKPDQVREHMEKAGIYLFTSDWQEGWGAVLNESMNSGCAVIASHAIGSVPFLVKDGENGIVYESGNVRMLYEKVKYLLDHPHEQKRLGAAAYETIVNTWNAEVAAERLLQLAEHILAGEKNPELFADGPCSRAEALNGI